MIQIKELTLYRGPNCLLQDTDFTAHAGWHIGVTGRNGSGKSTFFSLLQGQLQSDQGQIHLPADWRIAHMAQEVPALACPALSYVMDGDQELRQCEAELRKAEHDNDSSRISSLHQQLDNIDAWTAEARAAKLLTGLGFSQAQLDAPVSAFSGGWRMRLNLAQTLMCRSDLLLLDEPTNHLDLDAIIWLERWLQNYAGTLFLISHDRDFLDATVQHIVHLEHLTLNHYKGNFSQFEILRAQKLQLQQAAFEKQQAQIAHMQRYIDRFRAQATKARQAQSRVKALDRLERIAPAHSDSPFVFQFFAPDKIGDPLIRVDHADIGYNADEPVLQAVNLQLRPDSRLGLLGPNGAGKSTLIRSLIGELPLLSSQVHYNDHCVIGYFAQHQVDHLDLAASPLTLMQRLAPTTDELRLRAYLGGFDFRGDKVSEAIGSFSGGEKARLALALIIWRKPNVLLLDEPTNHLDLEMRHALTVALQSYEGALVVVSHDRHLIQNCTDELWLVADRQVTNFDGDLSDYANWLQQEKRNDNKLSQPEAAPETVKVDRRTERQREAEIRKQLRPLKKQVEQLEQKLAQLTQDNQTLEATLAEPDLYLAENKHQLTPLLQEKAVLDQRIDDTETAWLELQSELETREQALRD